MSTLRADHYIYCNDTIYPEVNTDIRNDLKRGCSMPEEGQQAQSSIGQMLKLIEDATDAWNSVDTIIELITGDDGGLSQVSAQLTELTSVCQAGFSSVVQAIANAETQREWDAFATKIEGIQQSIAGYSNELQSLDKNLTIIVNSKSYSFKDWCEGSSGLSGALNSLAGLAEQMWSLFQSGGVGNPPLLTVWSSVVQSGGNASAGQTQMTMLYALYQEFYGTLLKLFYVRENALQIYYNNYGKGDFLPLTQYTIPRYFGSVTSSDTTCVWAIFGAKFESILASTIPNNDHLLTATDGGDYTGTDSSMCIGSLGESSKPVITLDQNPISVSGQANTCFAQLQFASSQGTHFFLQGTPVTVGPGGVFTAGSPIPAGPGGLSGGGPNSVLPMMITLQDGPITQAPFFNGAYVTPPAQPTDPSKSLVVTGFQVTTVDGRIGIALQYGELDLTDINAPTVTVTNSSYVQPQPGGPTNTQGSALPGMFPLWTGSPAIETIDQRPVGTKANFPITNATFTPQSTRLGLYVQTAWTGYQAAAFQPTSALTFTPTVPATPAMASA
ncbi:hypothetical protein [Azospirillum argentinense]|nr:hypothetical protein [Azospirillum argentinense]